MGHDLFDGSRSAALRFDTGKGDTLRCGVFAVQKHVQTAADGECAGSIGEFADTHSTPLPASWLCAEVESPGAHMGLPLPRFQIWGRWQASG